MGSELHLLAVSVAALLIHSPRVFALPSPAPADGSCTFSLSATGTLSCPAGQLDDGQIRLNGSYPTAEFTIANGAITDSSGFGCIITESPITQIQCDEGKAALTGFAIDEVGDLSFNGSKSFYACPATDTEYNIYLAPDFGQLKCVPIGLVASGCGASPPPSPECPATTVWQTAWQTAWQTTTEFTTKTVTVTSNASAVYPRPTGGPWCPGKPPPQSPKPCKICTKSGHNNYTRQVTTSTSGKPIHTA